MKAVRLFVASNGVPYLQMTSVGSLSLSDFSQAFRSQLRGTAEILGFFRSKLSADSEPETPSSSTATLKYLWTKRLIDYGL